MNPLQLVMIAINGLSALTSSPALSGGSFLKIQEASKLLSLLGELVVRGEEGYRELKEFADSISVMVAENRAPTPTEWENLQRRSDVAHTTIQEAAKRAEAEEEAEKKLREVEDELDVLGAIDPEDLTPEQTERIEELNALLEE